MFLQLYEPPSEAIEDLHRATAIYTNDHVIDSLLDRLNWPNCQGRLLDPSAGDGAFILQALKRLQLGDRKNIDRVQGWEIHSGAAADARTRILDYLLELDYTKKEATAAAERIIINKDFLTEGPTGNQFQIIAGNPPYLRFQRLPEYFRTLYGDYLPKYAQGDLLHGFLDSCSRLIGANGTIGLVCSDRFLFNDTAANLRHELGTRIGIS
jgi:methylase of polypeptide subunit release factors